LAVYTSLELEDASSITRAHGLGETRAIVPIAAGSVNSNYFLDGDFGRVFLRIYEEQEREGVEYEWALLQHLAERGIPLPRILPGPEPGTLAVEGKPVALFELAGGEEYCQKRITPPRAAAVGEALARVHLAGRDFPLRKESRFGRPELRQRLRLAESAGRPELRETLSELHRLLDAIEAAPAPDLPQGVIHGDLFRDNVKYEGDAIRALLDWESASDGTLLYDLIVTMHAFTFGDDFDFELIRALFDAYDRTRPLEAREWSAIRDVAVEAAIRFTITRITDFYLRSGEGGEGRVMKDYRRFIARRKSIEAFTSKELIEAIRGR